MKKALVLIISVMMVLAFALTACGSGSSEESAAPEETTEAATEETTEAAPEVDGSAYGYAGTDPVECAVYKYMVENAAKEFDPADASIPTVSIVSTDDTPESEILVYGDFWVDNYKINGETLETVAGVNFPGVMHVSKDTYEVTAFDQVADGEDFDSSAKELFGDNYDAFMSVYGDDAARAELRKLTVSEYVKLNGLAVTQFQDYGWDPVELVTE